uniref:Uncharacterized protein n=1 Tax=Jeffords solemo-like virus TaxID=2716738 RepID=A0A6G7PSR9_9VIRU|nr:hypothetical protein [Jeffords solemo-like virus]
MFSVKRMLLVLSVVGLFGLSHHDSVVQKDKTVCENELSITLAELSERILEINDLKATVNDVQARLSKLQEYNAKLTGSYVELQNQYDRLSLYAILLTVLISLRVGWWLLPYLYAMFTTLIGAGCSSCSWLANIPRRLFSRVASHVGAYEDVELVHINASQFVNEAIVPNSPLKNVELYDRCIFKIYIVDTEFSDKLHYNGLGFWCNAGETRLDTQGVFMTVRHTLPCSGEVVLKSANDETKFVKMDVSEWKRLDEYDVAYYAPPQRITTTLGLRKAKVIKSMMRDCVVVTVYGRTQSSMGPMKPIAESVYVEYNGSTVSGFSGSPYIAGNTVYGMHIGSSQVPGGIGMGIDMAFVSLKLAHMTRFKEESSEDYLYDEICRGIKENKPLEWQRYGLDDVIVHLRGKDYFYDIGEFTELLELAERSQKRKFREEAAMPVQNIKKEAFVDIDALPKNCVAPTPALVVGANPVTDAQKPSNPKLQKLSSLPTPVIQTSMDGPASTHAPSNEVLQSMLESINALSAKVESLAASNAKLCARVYGASSKTSGKSPQNTPKKE